MSKQYIDKELAKRIANRIYSLIIAYNQPITSEKDKNLAKLETELANISFDVGTNNGSSDEIHYTSSIEDFEEAKINNKSISDKDIENKINEIIGSKLKDITDNLTKINDEFKRIDTYNLLLDAQDRGDLSFIHDYIHYGKLEKLLSNIKTHDLSVDNFSRLDNRIKELEEKSKTLEAVNHIDTPNTSVKFKVFKGYEKINDGFELHYSEYKIPKRKHPTDTGWDGYVCFPNEYDKEKTIYPGKTEVIPLGIIVDIPKGYEIQVRPRSGLSSKGIVVAFGSVDESYRGVIKATVYNSTKEPFVVKQFDRICQLVPARKPGEISDFVEADDNDYYDETDRGANGFGSTGV